MTCVVYCLVPDPEQLDPLVERLKDAGVRTEDIAIVPRRHWPSPTEAGDPSAPSAEASGFTPLLWGLSMSPAALWWQWALGIQAMAWSGLPNGHAVIPLEIYENKRAALKRR